MFWYWETVDWTATTVTRTFYAGTVGVTQRHCSDLKLTRNIYSIYSELMSVVDPLYTAVKRMKGEVERSDPPDWEVSEMVSSSNCGLPWTEYTDRGG